MKYANKEFHPPQTEIVNITPALALSWLEESKFHNRTVTDRIVDKIERDIKAGKWVFDGNPIKFNVNGDVIDGQHRLWAITKANKAVKSLVVRGLSEEAKDVIDTGKARSAGNVLQMNGFKNTNNLSAACRLSIGAKFYNGDLNAWASGQSKAYLSTNEILKEASENSGIQESLGKIQNYKIIKKLIGYGIGAYCHNLFSKIDPIQADEFFYLLDKGTGMENGHPVLALRNCLTIRDHMTLKLARGGNYRAAYVVGLITKAWNFFRLKKASMQIRFGDSEPYPLPK